MNKQQKEVEKAKLEAEKRELNHLKAIYKKASEDISNKIAISDGKINVLLKDIDNLDDTQKSILQSQIYQKKFQENLKKQIDGFMQELEAKQYESVDAYLKAAYETGYIGTMYDIAGQGIPLVMPIDQKAAARAMTHDTKLSKKLYTRLGEDVNLLKKRVANNIARGIATADSYANIARNIAEGTNIGINRTMTIARTEGHRIQVLGAVDAQQKAKDAGADVVKQWDAALDGRTRPHHRQLDGQIRELDEPFEVDGMEVMYPSGFGKASEDINCRCALLQRAKWALDDGEFTKMNNFTKQLETFESPKAYAEFKKGFFSAGNVRYMNYVEKMQAKYGTRDFRMVLDKMTEREYKHYSRLLANNPVFNTKVPNYKVANIPQFLSIDYVGNYTKETYETIETMVNKAIERYPENVRNVLDEFELVIGSESSACDAVNKILYIGADADEYTIDHEIGHFIESLFIDNKKLDIIKKEIADNAELVLDIRHDSHGNAVTVLCIKHEELYTIYQGRLYTEHLDDIDDAINDDGSIRHDLLWELVSETMPHYTAGEPAPNKTIQKLYDLIEEGITHGKK